MANTPYQTTGSANFSVPGPVTIGVDTSDTLGFFGGTPAAKQGGSALSTLSIATITSTTPYGFASKADADSVVNQVKAITAALAAYGIIKQA